MHGSAAAKTVKNWTLVYKDDAKGIILVETRQVIAAASLAVWPDFYNSFSAVLIITK